MPEYKENVIYSEFSDGIATNTPIDDIEDKCSNCCICDSCPFNPFRDEED